MAVVDNWVVGRTVVLLPYGGLRLLRSCETKVKDTAATTIQSLCRGHAGRQSIMLAQEAAKQRAIESSATLIASVFKAHVVCKRYAIVKGAVQFIQSVWRFRHARRKRADAVVRLQAFVRRVWAYRLFKARRAQHDQHSAALRIQTAYRTASARIVYLGVRACATFIQAWVRRCIAQLGYQRVLSDREPWLQFLQPNQAVVHTSLVNKTAESVKLSAALLKRKRKRQLILTSASPIPEIIYVDLAKMQVKGRIMWDDSHLSVSSVGEWDFEVGSMPSGPKDKELWVFEDLENPAACWVQSMPRALSVSDLVRGLGVSIGPSELAASDNSRVVVLQGLMQVQIKPSRKKKANKSQEMLVQLRRTGVLFCYHEVDLEIPFLCLNINCDTAIRNASLEEEVHVTLPTGMEVYLAPTQQSGEGRGETVSEPGLVDRWASELVKAKTASVCEVDSRGRIQSRSTASASSSSSSYSSLASSTAAMSSAGGMLTSASCVKGLMKKKAIDQRQQRHDQASNNDQEQDQAEKSKSKSERRSRPRRRSLAPQRRQRSLSRPLSVKDECVAMYQEANLLYSAKDVSSAVEWYSKILAKLGQDTEREVTAAASECDESDSSDSSGSSVESDYVDHDDDDDDDDDDDEVDATLGAFPAVFGGGPDDPFAKPATGARAAVASESSVTGGAQSPRKKGFKQRMSMQCWRRLAECHCKTGDLHAIVRVCRNGIHFQPQQVELYRYCAMAYQQLGGCLRQALCMLLDSSSYLHVKRDDDCESGDGDGGDEGDDLATKTAAIVRLFGELVRAFEAENQRASTESSVKPAAAVMQYNPDDEVPLLLSVRDGDSVLVQRTVRRGWVLARNQRTALVGFLPSLYVSYDVE